MLILQKSKCYNCKHQLKSVYWACLQREIKGRWGNVACFGAMIHSAGLGDNAFVNLHGLVWTRIPNSADCVFKLEQLFTHSS